MCHRAIRWSVLACVCVTLTAPPPRVVAADDAPAEVQTLEGRITGVEGLVQVRDAEDQPWRPATVGMKINPGAEFRTGPRSAVRFVIDPDQTITLDRLGTVKLLQAVREAGKIKTDVGMKYGRTRYDIEEAGLEHEAVLHSPGATLAIRGTQTSLFDQVPYTTEARTLRGKSQFKAGKKPGHEVKAGGKATGDNPDSALLAKDESVVDPVNPFSRTGAEQDVLNQMSALGALALGGFGGSGGLGGGGSGGMMFHGGGGGDGTPPPAPLVGQLNFFVSWIGIADMDMFVISPLGEGVAVFPPGGIPVAGYTSGPATTSPSGGAIVRDITSPNGVEQINWNTNAPDGTYIVGTRVFSGGNVTVKIDGYLNGQHLKPTFTTHLDNQGDFTSTTFVVNTGGGD